MNWFRCGCSRWQCLGLGIAVLSIVVTLLSNRNAIPKLDTVLDLTTEMLIAQEPVFIHPPEAFSDDLTALGLNGFASWKERYGTELVSLGEDPDTDVEVCTFGSQTVSGYIDTLLDQHRKPKYESHADQGLSNQEFHLRLSETWGSYWFFDRPSIIQALSRLYAPLIPDGFRDGVWYSNEELARMTREEKHAEQTFVLWAAPAKYKYSLHADFVSGTLLTHLDGNKTVWLYPPAHAKYLYLYSKEDNWEAISPVDPMNPDYSRFPMFALARPTVINLNRGDVLFIPCGWPHFVHYEEPALSIGVNLWPDWLASMENSCKAQGKDFLPSSCRDLLVQPSLVECAQKEKHT
mmetsp:Transcript_61430/g.109616  ORF Transcript_61430/g.109616 Transcript_61430/m.109616 type:complete len:349 (-) Transcript_61430:2-1048(-)